MIKEEVPQRTIDDKDNLNMLNYIKNLNKNFFQEKINKYSQYQFSIPLEKIFDLNKYEEKNEDERNISQNLNNNSITTTPNNCYDSANCYMDEIQEEKSKEIKNIFLDQIKNEEKILKINENSEKINVHNKKIILIYDPNINTNYNFENKINNFFEPLPIHEPKIIESIDQQLKKNNFVFDMKKKQKIPSSNLFKEKVKLLFNKRFKKDENNNESDPTKNNKNSGISENQNIKTIFTKNQRNE